MQVFLIEENLNKNFFKRFFRIIKIEDDRIILNYEIEKMNFNKKVKTVQKIKEFLDLSSSNKVIISNNLKKDSDFVNLLYSKEIDIIRGKYLFKALINKFIENICIENNLKKEETQIGITVNNADEWAYAKIETLAKEFKAITIVTNHINKFKNIQQKFLEEQGIILTVTNNKKKALAKANIILNIDFPEELINKYCIYDNAILINLEEKIKINKKRFNGKIINDYKIKLKNNSQIELDLKQEKYKNFDVKDLAEIYVINSQKEIENIIISEK